MSFSFLFAVSSYSLVLLGLIALFLTEELALPYLFMASASFVLGALSEVSEKKRFLPETLANIAIVAVFAYTVVSIFFLGAEPLQGLVHFLLALQCVKLLAPRKGRDWLQLYLLSFFSILAASALSVELSFAVIFVCYLLTAPWVLVLFHLKGATEAAGKNPDRDIRLMGRPLLRLVGSINVALLLLTLTLFVTIPRLSAGFLGHTWATGSGVTGFSDRLALGQVAEIQKNSAVAMRVSLDEPGPRSVTELYWRGVSLDRFDGQRWLKSRSDPTSLSRQGDTFLLDERMPDTKSLIRQSIILEPNGSAALFTLSKPVAITGRIPYLSRDPLGNLQGPYPFPFQISYEALSQPELGRENPSPGQNFLQLPPLDPRIIQLSQRITEGIEDERRKIAVLERYLKQSYRYSLNELPLSDKDPLSAFLFDVRQGNCEYFASALAVMLRILGIPTRVVNGYLGGEWNAYGEYYLVRQSNAHSWVEAYLPDKGWVTLDPTPPIPARSEMTMLSFVTHFVDFLRIRWYRYVVNFTFGDQFQLFIALKQPHSWLRFTPQSFTIREVRRFSSADIRDWIGLALLVAGLAVGWNRWRKTKGKKHLHTQSPAYRATERYHRFLATLRKRKLVKKAAETADEFSRRAEILGNGLVKDFTALYQEARFSGHQDFTEGLKKMDQILSQLRKAPNSAKGPHPSPHLPMPKISL